MSIRSKRGLAVLMVCVLAIAAQAQPRFKKDFIDPEVEPADPEIVKEMEREPAFKSWRYVAVVKLPEKESRYVQLDVPADVIGKSQPELHDLRLADADGERVPYVLRVLKAERSRTPVRVERRFNAGTDAKTGAYQESFELGVNGPQGYNEVEIDTSGLSFRRRVELQGADNAEFKGALSLLAGDAFLNRLVADGKLIDTRSVRFDSQRFRFLRVQVFPDANNKDDKPRIQEVAVRQTIIREGEEVTRTIDAKPEQQYVSTQGVPGTAWLIDFGQPVYVSRLTFRAARAAERGFQLQVADPGQPRYDLGPLDWSWKEKDGGVTLQLRFPEVRARRLRFVVADFANEPLQLSPESYGAAQRRLYFETPDAKKLTLPLKLYFGNAHVGPPRYDLEKTLPEKIEPAPQAATLGEVTANPNYVPPPLPFHERHKWAVYAVLTAASLLLVGLLLSLAKQIKPKESSVEAKGN